MNGLGTKYNGTSTVNSIDNNSGSSNLRFKIIVITIFFLVLAFILVFLGNNYLRSSKTITSEKTPQTLVTPIITIAPKEELSHFLYTYEKNMLIAFNYPSYANVEVNEDNRLKIIQVIKLDGRESLNDMFLFSITIEKNTNKLTLDEVFNTTISDSDKPSKKIFTLNQIKGFQYSHQNENAYIFNIVLYVTQEYIYSFSITGEGSEEASNKIFEKILNSVTIPHSI